MGLGGKRVKNITLIAACPIEYKRTAPPPGIGYIASVLMNEGYEVNFIDPSPLNLTSKDVRKIFQDTQPDVAGIYCCSTDRYEAFDMAKSIKEVSPDTTVVMGGPHVTATANITLERIPSIDIIVRHEGEVTMKELMNRLNEGGHIHDVKGITFRKEGNVVSTPPREFIQDLDSLPYPAYHLYPPFEKYAPHGVAGNRRSCVIMSSRGCTFSCPFCYAVEFWGRRFRARSPKSVVDEMEHLKDEFEVEFIKFFDDAFTLDPRRAEKICDEIIRRKVGLKFLILSRVDTINRQLLKKLSDAGCEEIQYGVETASPRLLKDIGKGITIDRVESVLKWTKEVGIQTYIFMMQGLPGETLEDVELNFRFLKRNQKYIDIMESAITMILPGTPLYYKAKSLGLVDDEAWFSYEPNNEFLSRDPFSRYLPPYLENFKLEELIRIHRLTHIVFHTQGMPGARALRAILGYLWNYLRSPSEYSDLIRTLARFSF